MGDAAKVTTFVVAVGDLLVAGVFYAFSTFVISGLRRPAGCCCRPPAESPPRPGQ